MEIGTTQTGAMQTRVEPRRGAATRRRPRGVVGLVVALVAGLVTALTAIPAAAVDDCQASRTATVRGKQVTLDQCYQASQEIDGTTYGVLVYYREAALAANTNQCTAADGAGRCEHELPDNDNADGDNVVAVSVGDETLDALAFYIDEGISPLTGSDDTMEVLIAEDPRGGGVIYPDTLYWDDELVVNGLLLRRLLAEHESMHLIQGRLDGTIGWASFYGEGISRAIEDRIDPAMDASAGGFFMPEVNGILGSESDRTNQLENTTYRSVLFWTYLFDRFATPGDVEPQIGWDAVEEFYDELSVAATELDATNDFIAANGSSFYASFTAYAQSLWANRFSPPAPLGFTDAEISTTANQLSGHPVITAAPTYPNTTAVSVNPRSVNFREYTNPSCDFLRADFDGRGTTFTTSLMAADSGAWVGGWESTGTQWSRTIRTDGLDRLALLVVGRESAGTVDVTAGCVDPSVTITSPTTAAFASVGTADNPRSFITRLSVDAAGSPVAGLLGDDFSVTLTPVGGGAAIPATVVTSTYVLDDYWLLVQAPSDADGAQTGLFYDLRVDLGAESDTNAQSVLYVERAQDTVIVLDRSGSMGDDGKIQAARNAANLFVNQLADDDQGAFVAFDTDATLREQLDPAGAGGHRGDLITAIGNESPAARTSIGDGMRTAATAQDDRGDSTHVCSFVLLSDGHENEPDLWADVRDQVADNGCAVHAVALGPEANEPLMQQISAVVAGGSYDYAPTVGDVGVGGATAGGSTGTGGGSGASSGVIGWENNVGRLYDFAATKTSGRQRVFAADGDGARGSDECSDESVRVSYETLTPAADTYAVKTSFVSDGVTHVVDSFDFGNGQSTSSGFAFTRSAGIDSADVGTNNVRIRPLLPDGACRLGIVFEDQGGSENLEVNGDLRAVGDLTELDGATVGGAAVAVTFDQGTGLGEVVVTGAITSFAIGGQEFAIDNLEFQTAERQRFTFFVDDSADELVLSLAWQELLKIGPDVALLDPDSQVVPVARLRAGADGRNQVWTVPTPKPGTWTVLVGDLPVEYLVTAQVDSLFELHAYTGAAADDAAGSVVPILASFSRPGGPVVGGTVVARVTSPSGQVNVIALRDDGGHGDGAADDGVYGGHYRATSEGDVTATDPAEGEAPAVVGSHLVDVVGISGDVRREAQASFALLRGTDGDKDGLPDTFEQRDPRLDPEDPTDAGKDPDRDGVTTRCELLLGTDPFDADSDDGGESDGSELGFPNADCKPTGTPGRPLDPSDDDPVPVTWFDARPSRDAEGPLVVVRWTDDQDEKVVYDLTRTCGLTVRVFTGRTSTLFLDRDVAPGQRCVYTLVPRTPDGNVGPPLDAPEIIVLADPFAPEGSVQIDGGAATTSDTTVDLQLSADDTGDEGDGGPPTPGAIGDDTTELEMRISNDPDLSGVAWGPFAATVAGWDLGDVAPGAHAVVHVQFRDRAGNVSSTSTDTILLAAGTRLGGEDRIATGAVISDAAFRDGGAEIAVLARSDVFADALAGTPLAIRRSGPLLLTRPAALSSATATELQRVLPAGRTVYLLGGTAALSQAVEDAVTDLGYVVVRLAGDDRYETAALTAAAVGDVSHVLIARGDDFPDALAAGAAAGFAGGSVVLTRADRATPATDAYLAAHPGSEVWAVGGPATRAYPDARPLQGPDRFATAKVVAEAFFAAPEYVGVSRADNFADSLGGGVHAGRHGGPIMLTRSGALETTTEGYLCGTESLALAFVYGGPSAVSQTVADAIQARIEGAGC